MASRAVRRLAALLSVALPFVAGCNVGPDFRSPKVAVNQSWSAREDPRIATQTAADELWWKSFNDPVLDRLVELAYRQNLPLQIAGLRIVEARAQLGIATGMQFPQVQNAFAGANAVGLTKQQSLAIPIKRNFFTYSLGFDAAWEIDFWGKYRRGIESETASLYGTVADYYSALVSLTAEVARTYALIRTYQALIREAGENVGLQEQALKIADARFHNGATSELDVAQATTLLESTRATIPKLSMDERRARNALCTLVGQTTGTVDALLSGPSQIPRAPARIAVSVPAEMLRRRPDIRSAELAAAAQCARIGVAKAELYPSFSILGTVGLSANSAGFASHNLFTADALVYSVGPQIVLPIFNYGRLTNGVRVQDARFQELLVGYRDAVLKAAQEVEDALVGFLNSQDAMVFEQRSVDAAMRAEELAVVQYQEGATDFERVVDSQRFLLQQVNNLTQTRSSVAINLVAVYKALGGGWESRQGQAVVPERTQQEMKERTNWDDLLTPPQASRRPKFKGQ